MKYPKRPKGHSAQEVAKLRARLAEAEETLRAISEGRVDALVVNKPEGTQIYSISGAETPYRFIIEEMNEGALLLSREGAVLYANARFAQWINKPLEQVIGSSWDHCFIQPDRARLSRLLAAAKSTSSREEFQLQANGATSRPVSVSLSWMERQQVQGFSVVVTDLTTRKRAQEELRKSEERLRQALGAAFAGAWEWEIPTGKIVWSKENYDLYGLVPTANVPTWEDWERNVHPDDLAVVKQAVQDAIEGRNPEYRAEFRVRHPRRGERWILGLGRVERAQDGTPWRLSGINIEITLSKRTEAALRESEQRYRALFETTSDGVWIVDLEGNILEVNDAYCRMSGYSREALQRMSVSMLEVFESPSKVAAHIAKIQAAGHDRFETQHRRKDGSVIDVDTTVLFLDREGGQIAAFIRDITQRKQTEILLESQAQHLEQLVEERTLALSERAQLLELSSDAIMVRDLHDRITYWNSGAEQMYGWKREEACGKVIHDLLKTSFPEPLRKILQMVKRRSHWTGELVHTRRDGSRLTVATRWAVQKDAAGKVVGILESNTDITEHKNAEEALRQSEEQFRTLAESIPNLAWWANADGYITWYNRRWYEYTGTTPEQMEGWGWQSVHNPEVLPRVMQRWKNSIATGEPFDMEFPLRGKDGKFRLFLTRVQPLKDAAGCVLRWFGTNTDVDELKQAAEALLQSQQRYAALHDHAPFAVGLMQHPDGIIREVNEAWEKLFECRREEALGKTSLELGLVSDPEGRARMYEELRRRGSVREWEMPFCTRTGKRRIGSFNCELIEINGMQYHLGTTLDITERKLLEKRILTAVEEERQRLGRDLHDGLCHSLTATKFKISLLESKLARKTKVNPAEAEALEQAINRAIEQARSMAHGLNPVTLVGQGLVSALEELAGYAQKTYGLDCVCKCLESTAIADQTTALHLYRIAQEAVNNSIKHAKPRTVSIQLQNTKDGLFLTVTDDGIGFSLASEQTAGMGLHNMKSRAEAIGGVLTIQSSQGHGTVVTCIAPRPPTQAES